MTRATGAPPLTVPHITRWSGEEYDNGLTARTDAGGRPTGIAYPTELPSDRVNNVLVLRCTGEAAGVPLWNSPHPGRQHLLMLHMRHRRTGMTTDTSGSCPARQPPPATGEPSTPPGRRAPSSSIRRSAPSTPCRHPPSAGPWTTHCWCGSARPPCGGSPGSGSPLTPTGRGPGRCAVTSRRATRTCPGSYPPTCCAASPAVPR